MKKGLSGANITIENGLVRKQGRGAAAQGEYCKTLGDVCPRIYSIDHEHDYYDMEILKEPSYNLMPALFSSAKQLLQTQVWSQRALYGNGDWRVELIRFAENSGYDMRVALGSLYKGLPSQCLIHGDPTLANMMLRVGTDVEVVLIDPIQPVGKIPSFREVDLGKMLQSALGWEVMLGMTLKFNAIQAKEIILADENDLTIRRAVFWCLIHLLRTLPYLQKAGMVQEIEWVEDTFATLGRDYDFRL